MVGVWTRARFSSLAPIIAVALFQATHSALPISLYMAATLSVVAALAARETKGETFETIDARAG